MKNMPYVSVIMPCYNSQEYLENSIMSIIKQTFTEFEFIIVNDGSIDQTQTIIRSYTDKRIRYLEIKQNLGNYQARNLGLALAKGKYICMIDSDDLCRSDRLEIQFNTMQKNYDLQCLGSQSEIIDKYGKKIGAIARPLSFESIKIMLLKNNCMTQSSLMIRHEFLKKYNLTYNNKFRYAGDYDFVVRLSRYGKLLNIKEQLIQYRMHDSQISEIKRLDQLNIANAIRMSQLNFMGIYLPNDKHKVMLKWMNDEMLDNDKEVYLLESMFNGLIKANDKKRIYNQYDFYNFLDIELKKAYIRQNFTNSC